MDILAAPQIIEGSSGQYCCRTCRYDAEIMDVDFGEITPRGRT